MTNPADNLSTLVAAFAKSLAIAPDRVVDTLAYNAIAEWDSTAHMLLVSELEGAFGVMLDDLLAGIYAGAALAALAWWIEA